MKPQIRKLEAAKRDLTQHFVYIGEHDTDAAFRFIQAAQNAFELLAANPFLGAERRFRRARYRRVRLWPIDGFSKYIVFYRPIRTGVEVVRILHASQDYERVMGL